MPNHTLTTILIGNPKGGIGKTTVSQMAVAEADTREPGRFKFVSIDDQKTSTRMGGVLGRRIDLNVAANADLTDIESSGGVAALEHLDPVGDAILSSDTIIDTGANTQKQLILWLVRSRLPELAARKGVRFIVCAVSDGTNDSVDGAIWMLRNFHKALAPNAQFKVILNDRNGRGFSGEGVKDLLALADQLAADVINIPHSRSRLLHEGLERKLSPLDTYVSADEVAKSVPGLSGLRLERERCDLLDFLAEVRAAVSPLLPDTKAEAA